MERMVTFASTHQPRMVRPPTAMPTAMTTAMPTAMPPIVPESTVYNPPEQPKQVLSSVTSAFDSPLYTSIIVFTVTCIAIVIIDPPFIHTYADDDTARGPIDILIVIGWGSVAVAFTFLLEFVKSLRRRR